MATEVALDARSPGHVIGRGFVLHGHDMSVRAEGFLVCPPTGRPRAPNDSGVPLRFFAHPLPGATPPRHRRAKALPARLPRYAAGPEKSRRRRTRGLRAQGPPAIPPRAGWPLFLRGRRRPGRQSSFRRPIRCPVSLKASRQERPPPSPASGQTPARFRGASPPAGVKRRKTFTL
jgi:hypothetical protein